MERDIWTRITSALKRLPRTRPRNAVYTDAQILAVLLWAALHDRPVSWACHRANWPMQAWRRERPDQSTMSRRLRTPGITIALWQLACILQRGREVGEVAVADGKPLEVSEHSRDPDARSGRGAGRYSKGYKLHAIADPAAKVFAGWDVQPLNVSETTTAARLLRRRRRPTRLPNGTLLLGDKLYDSNPLHRAAAGRGVQLIAPRKRPGMGLGSRRHHPHRLESIRFTEGADKRIWEEVLAPQRAAIERFFGTMASFGGGLSALPPWVRRLHRVRLWVNAKICIYAARISLRLSLDA
jgi:hypothetical protein